MSPPRPQHRNPSPCHRTAAFLAATLTVLAVAAVPAQALTGNEAAQAYAQGSPCSLPRLTTHCTDWGAIVTDYQQKIDGERIDAAASIYLDLPRDEQSVRWVMFSVRNVTEDGNNPVTVEPTSFTARGEPIHVNKVDQPSANEVAIWVDILDVPMETPIELHVEAGATERGAYQLEFVVMPFDRGYVPLPNDDGGVDVLFAASFLAVNGETSGINVAGSGNLIDRMTPGVPVVMVVAAVLLAGVAARRR